MTPEIRLVPVTADLLATLDAAERFRDRYGADISGHLDHARDVVTQTLALERLIGATSPWGGYLTVAVRDGTVVGGGGFKGNPTAEGTVEIAYFTFPEYEGRGFGSATARALVAIAEADPAVRDVIAHTLPTPGASTRILERVGFAPVADVVDPDDGPVWRWRRGR